MTEDRVKSVLIEEEGDSPDFRSELSSLLNRFSRENISNTPDCILRNFIWNSLKAFDSATIERDEWYGFNQGESNLLGRINESNRIQRS